MYMCIHTHTYSAIIANLLKGNPSNATFFREMGCVGNHLVPLLNKGLQQQVFFYLPFLFFCFSFDVITVPLRPPL